MKLFLAKLTERIKRTPAIESFRFVSEEKVDFYPGQFIELIFDENNKENKELNKYLSISSSPLKDYVEVTKRLSDSKFSDKLRSLRIGERILFKPPLGACIFKDDYKKIAFLIGGIGITPAVSILEYIIGKKLDTDVILIYSNKREWEIAFRKELDDWQLINKNLKVFYIVTDCQPQDSKCMRGRISKELMKEKISDFNERIFFIFGPPGMAEVVKNLCLDSDCKKENIKTESFIGY